MTYTINKSDPAKTSITVPSSPPYENVSDTSLTLVGQGNPSFGSKFATNFVKLLENFASPTSPANPIEGQLWYDTSAPNNKILKVYNNTTWVPTNGVHKAEDKNTLTGIVSPGDIYVHPRGLDQVHLWDGDNWIPIGPAIASGTKTGVFPEKWTPNDGTADKFVIASYLNDDVITVITNEEFTPTPVRNGFTTLKPGLNVSSQSFSGSVAKVSGLSDAATHLKITNEATPISADYFLRNDETGSIAGFLSVNGLRVGSITPTVTLERNSNNVALLTNRTNASSIGLSVIKNSVVNQILTVDGDNLRVGVNKVQPAASLDVNGTAIVSGLTLIGTTGTNSLVVFGDTTIEGPLTATNSINFSSTLTISLSTSSGSVIVPSLPTAYDIGTSDAPFRTVYAQNFANTTTLFSYVLTGMVMLYAGNGVPEGWLECSQSPNPAVVLDATTGTVFTRLYNAIGNSYGGTGATDFQLPVFPDSTVLYGVAMKPLIKL